MADIAPPALRVRMPRSTFPVLQELAAAGASDYFALLVGFGAGDPARGTGVGYSFATTRPRGFRRRRHYLAADGIAGVSLALMADAEHRIASGLLAAYLGEDAGRRVHAGAVARGSVDRIRAVLWFADIRGSTAIAETTPGLTVIELLDEVFETLTAALAAAWRTGPQISRRRDAGDLPLRRGCTRSNLPSGARRRRRGDARDRCAQPGAPPNRQAGPEVDVALHLGDVLYGNVGAIDRLDFTVIGPAVNEAARIEALCEPLDCNVLVSAEFAAAVPEAPLRLLGRHPSAWRRRTAGNLRARF